jgi:hypothetical protein
MIMSNAYGGSILRNTVTYAKLAPIILPLALIELFFFFLHFIGGFLLIALGFLGSMAEILIKLCVPKAYL